MSDTPLHQMHCEACRADAPRLTDLEINALLADVADWEVAEEDGVLRLRRIFDFRNWAEAAAFANAVGDLAEREDHHPAIGLEWGKVVVWWWTHKIKGLHRNDFIAAAHTDRLYDQNSASDSA